MASKSTFISTPKTDTIFIFRKIQIFGEVFWGKGPVFKGFRLSH